MKTKQVFSYCKNIFSTHKERVGHKKKIAYLGFAMVFFTLYTATSYAVTCWPAWDGDRTVETSCDFPVGYKVYGDIIVGANTVNVNNGTLGIDLSARKITFTTGKMMFSNGKADNTVSTRYKVGYAYSLNSGVSNCPAGTTVMDPPATNKMLSGAPSQAMVTTGQFYCAK